MVPIRLQQNGVWSLLWPLHISSFLAVSETSVTQGRLTREALLAALLLCGVSEWGFLICKTGALAVPFIPPERGEHIRQGPGRPEAQPWLWESSALLEPALDSKLLLPPLLQTQQAETS